MQDINYFDLIILSIVLVLGLKGLFSGFVKELFGLIGIVSGIYLGSDFAYESGCFINEHIINIKNQSALSLFGFLSIFISIWVLFHFLGLFVSRLTQASGLGVIDRLFGFIFGAGKIFVIFAVIVYALSNVEFIYKMTQKYIQNSLLYPHLINVGKLIVKIDPQSLNPTKNNTMPLLPKDENTTLKRVPLESI